MDLYFELMQYPVFSIGTLKKYYDNEESARTALKRLIKRKRVQRIRNNMYTCTSGEYASPIADRFQIASVITKTSVVSHHTALEYYGAINQVFYEVYVSSETKFNDFSFDGYTYECVPTKISEGIEKIGLSGGVRITDKERTIVDSIKDMGKISGIEEVDSAIPLMTGIDETKVLKYLKAYKNKSLYQKVGFMLFQYRKILHLSEYFFDECRFNIGKNKAYLSVDSHENVYSNEWRLMVPKEMFDIKSGGEITNDRV
ncbi:MAG: hypothetical protein VB031_04105 [Eubacteriaceae bacterium]|nr:hypothetical protein [Eubacteriaceae bacterium]